MDATGGFEGVATSSTMTCAHLHQQNQEGTRNNAILAFGRVKAFYLTN
jgi:hypothetical protein